MRAFAPVVAFVIAAGCLGVSPPGADALVPRAPAPFEFLLCEGDALVKLGEPREPSCNWRATVDSGPATEVHVAVNPRNPLNLVGGSKDFSLGEDSRCGKFNVWSGVYVTFDGGRSWNHSLLPGHPGDDRRTALSDYACGSDPVIAFGPDGTAYYASIHLTLGEPGDLPPQTAPVTGYNAVNSSVAVTRSRDGGRSWDDPVILAARDDGTILDKEWMAVDASTGAIFVTYIDNGVLVVQRSDDRGATWTDAATIVASGDWPDKPSQVQFGQVVVAPDSVVHFTFWGSVWGTDASSIWASRSEDRGESWSAPVRVAPFYPVFDLEVSHKYRIVPNPAMAVDASSGALYVTYPFYVGPPAAPGGNLDVYLVRSTDGGASWSAPVRVNDDLPSATNGQWMPALAVGPDGTVHATWLDSREDPRGQFARAFYSFSRDGGASWSPNAAVGDVAFDGTGGYHQSGAGTIGDYMGLAASELAVTAFFSDTRDGRNDVFAAIVPS